MAEPHASYDELVDLALDDSERRDPELLRHMAECGSCRGRYDEVVTGVEQVLTAAPRIDPPPGFDRNVLTAMGMTPSATASRPRAWWRRAPLLVAAAVLGVVIGFGGSLVWTALLGESSQSPVGAEAAALDTPAGDRVGTVTRSYLDGDPVMVVDVHDGVVGKRYDCVLVLAGGATRSVGSWVMESPQATWVVPLPSDQVAAVRLVTGEGRVWSAADLGG